MTPPRPRLRTAEEYRESLRDGRRVFYRGEAVEDVTTHPVFAHAVDHAALDFDLAHDPSLPRRWRSDRTATAATSTCRATAEDLLARSALIEASTRAGQDARAADQGDRQRRAARRCWRFAASSASRTRRRIRAFYEHCRDGDLAVCVAQTDVKGDRSLGPVASSRTPTPTCGSSSGARTGSSCAARRSTPRCRSTPTR